MEFIKNRDKVAIIYNNKEYSYKELIAYSKEYGKMLEICSEDRIVIFMENRPELIFSFLGIWDKKGTCVCLDSSSKVNEMEYFLKDCQPKYVFTSNSNIEILKEALKNTGLNEIKILNIDEIEVHLTEEKESKIIAPERERVVLMLYTSGTTGNPKGVMLTFDNILVNIEGLEKYKMYTSEDRILALLPMHHIFPLLGSGIIPMHKGGTIIFLKDLSSQSMLEALKRYEITLLLGVPRLWEMLHKKIIGKINSNKVVKGLFKICEKLESPVLSKKIFKKVHEVFGGNIRFLVSGGSKLNPEISQDFKTLGFSMCEGYGLTETAPMISFTPIGENIPGSAGRILDGVQVRIEDDGEILVKGRNVMKGYYNKPQETREAIDENGWFHTGDLGEVKDGFIYITGRKKEMIVLSNGKNINPVEIEQSIIKDCNLIEEIAIIEYNKILTAVIYPNFAVLKKEKINNILETLKNNIIDKYNGTVANYKKILDIKIVQNELPKTKIGKLRRFLIPQFLEDTKKERKEEKIPEFEEYKEIVKYLKNLKSQEIYSTDHLELDLGLDSLDFVEFFSFIENSFGVKIDENILEENPTIIELSEYIKENSKGINIKNINWGDILKEDSKEYFGKTNKIGKLIKLLLKPIFLFYIKIEREGEIQIKEKPTIFIGNHQSFLDGFILSQSMENKLLDETYFLAKIDHFNNSIMKYLGNSSNIILIDKNKDMTESLRAMSTALRKGKNVVIFPEGTRTRDGKMKEFKKFYAILAKELNVEVVPFGIKGAYSLFPAQNKFPKKGKVKIKFFKRMSVESLSIEEIVEKNFKEIKEWTEN